MSRHTHRCIAVSLALVGAALIAACDTPTQPQPRAARVTQFAKIDGDTTLCTHGWQVVQGAYQCNPY